MHTDVRSLTMSPVPSYRCAAAGFASLLVGGAAATANADGLFTPAAATLGPMCVLDRALGDAASRGAPPSSTEAPAEPGHPSMCPPPDAGTLSPLEPKELPPGTARSAMREARRLADEGRIAEALLHLRVVERVAPAVADRVALLRGRLLLEADEPEDACEAFRSAERSPEPTVEARAEVGSVRCAIQANARDAQRKLRELTARYPELPEETELRFELARAKERAGARQRAGVLYRRIDERHPTSRFAAKARERLQALRDDGVRIWPLSDKRRVERAERVLRIGPADQAERAIRKLLDANDLSAKWRAQAHMMAVRRAKREGRWEAARAHLAKTRRLRVLPDGVTRRELEAKAGELADVVHAGEQERAARRIRRLKGRARFRVLPIARLAHIVRIASAAELTETVDGALKAMVSKGAPPRILFDATLHAIGAASHERVLAALGKVREFVPLETAARYHYARTLERLGRWNEAEIEHIAVLDDPHGDWANFYAMWSDQRLSVVREAILGSCKPEEMDAMAVEPSDEDEADADEDDASDAPDTEKGRPLYSQDGDGLTHPGDPDLDASGESRRFRAALGAAAAFAGVGAPLRDQFGTRLSAVLGPSRAGSGARGAATGTAMPWARSSTADTARTPDSATELKMPVPRALDPEPRRPLYASLAGLPDAQPMAQSAAGTGPSAQRLDEYVKLADELAPVARRWGDAFPWLPRAETLLRLGEVEAAADELHETYLAWRHARGHTVRFVGLESIYRGDRRSRRRASWSTRRNRRRLDEPSREVLIEVAHELGEQGLALGFDKWDGLEARPRPYETLVEEAARRHDLDPNLLFAVMRIESVYQKRIVSYAGAVGLMQIMPFTGHRIANHLGYENFTTSDLLSPRVNIGFAAWYLSSLMERFDGRLPLAIAAYNGGPHNVRRWMKNHPENMPLDAFLEHIPFKQTYRYVRRVLGHYAAYRDQQGLPMQRLQVRLPELEADRIGF